MPNPQSKSFISLFSETRFLIIILMEPKTVMFCSSLLLHKIKSPKIFYDTSGVFTMKHYVISIKYFFLQNYIIQPFTARIINFVVFF